MIIANIVTESKINVGKEFNVIPTVDDIIFDKLPTLIVGYDTVVDIYGANEVNMLDRQISDNIYWTFKKNVKRSLYSNDLEDFILLSYKMYVDKLTTVSPDVIQDSPRKIRNIIKKILSLKDLISYESELGVIYIYSSNIICCVDLNLLEYSGCDYVKVQNKIKSKSSVYLSGNEIILEYQNHLERLNDDIKLIPLLYYINSHE